MSSFLRQSTIKRWLIPYLYDMRHRATLRHTAEATLWTGTEEAFRAAMFADTHGAWYVLERPNTIAVFIGKDYYRSTRLYHLYEFDTVTRKQISYREARFGETAGLLRKYDHVWIINGRGAKDQPHRHPPTLDNRERREQTEAQLINQISVVISRSSTYKRAQDIAQSRLTAKDFQGCSEVCLWLQASVEEDEIVKYVLQGYVAGFATSDQSRHWRPSITWIIRQFVEFSDPKDAAVFKRKIVMYALDAFKKDFTKNVYGKLMNKLSN